MTLEEKVAFRKNPSAVVRECWDADTGQLSPSYPGKHPKFWADPIRRTDCCVSLSLHPSPRLPHGPGGSHSDLSPVTAVFPGEGVRESPDDSHRQPGDTSLSHRTQRPQCPLCRRHPEPRGETLGTCWSPRCSRSPWGRDHCGPRCPVWHPPVSLPMRQV